MIYKRNDGSFVIEKNEMPFHVAVGDDDYDSTQALIDAGAEWELEVPIQTNSDTEYDEETNTWILPVSAVALKYHAKITTERNTRVEAGFEYEGYTIQADDGSQSIAHQYLTKYLAGVEIFPLLWRTKDNQYLTLSTITEFTAFTDAMTLHVNTQFSTSWTAKDDIDAASTEEEILEIYNSYMEV